MRQVVGHIDIVKLCKEWGATKFDWAMENAAEGGHNIDISNSV